MFGGRLELSVEAVSEASGLCYEWRKDGVAIAGACESNLILEGVSFGSEGRYSVVVSNGKKEVTSGETEVSLSIPSVEDEQEGRVRYSNEKIVFMRQPVWEGKDEEGGVKRCAAGESVVLQCRVACKYPLE